MPNLTKYLIDITRQILCVDNVPVTQNAHFAKDLNADSLECLELMMAMEEAFEVEFDDSIVSELTTVSAVADYLRARAQDSPVLSDSSGSTIPTIT